jgi:hypothetical protein
MTTWEYVCDHCGRKNKKQLGPCRWCGKDMIGEWASCNTCQHAKNIDYDETERLDCKFEGKVCMDDLCKRYFSVYRK